MNKLFLLLILSFFSTQGFAGSCPDGSEPVRSISADGSYYVNQCPSFQKPLMESIDKIDYSYYAKSDFVNLKIPEDFQYINTTKLKYLMSNNAFRRHAETWWWEDNAATSCFDAMKYFKVTTSGHGFDQVNGCVKGTGGFLQLDYPYVLKNMSDVILHHATHRNVKEQYKPGDTPNHQHYAKYMLMANTAEIYAVFKDLMPLTPEEHEIITAYFDEIFMGNLFHTQLNKPQCNINNPELDAPKPFKDTAINGCGTYSWHLVYSSIAYSLSTNNNKLFERAKMNLTHLLGSFDNEGIHVMQASRGGKAMGYHNAVTVNLGNISEQFYAIGYDFLEHRMPRSNIKVKDVLDKHWDMLHDHTLLGKYAKYSKGIQGSEPNTNWHNVSHLSTPDAILMMPSSLKWWQVAHANTRYVKEYRTQPTMMHTKEIDWQTMINKNNVGNLWIASVFPSKLMYEVNISRGNGDLIKIEAEKKKEKKRIDAEKKKEKKRIDAEKYQERLKVEKERLRVEAEVEAEACKTTPLDGEYEARWIRDHWRDIGEWEFVGSEPLILDQCEGQFEGIKQFDPFPTPSVRKKLIVKYQTNGDISIKGDLNLYGIDDLRYTGLYGNIHDGEISGIWGVRNRLKIELIKK